MVDYGFEKQTNMRLGHMRNMLVGLHCHPIPFPSNIVYEWLRIHAQHTDIRHTTHVYLFHHFAVNTQNINYVYAKFEREYSICCLFVVRTIAAAAVTAVAVALLCRFICNSNKCHLLNGFLEWIDNRNEWMNVSCSVSAWKWTEKKRSNFAVNQQYFWVGRRRLSTRWKIETIWFGCMCVLCRVCVCCVVCMCVRVFCSHWHRRFILRIRTILFDTTKCRKTNILVWIHFLLAVCAGACVSTANVFGIFIVCGAFGAFIAAVTFVFLLNTYHK